MSTYDIIHAVAQETGVAVQDILSNRRYRSVVTARKLAARRLRLLGMSYPEIGRALGGRHHTSAMYLCGDLDEYRDRKLIAEVALLMASPETRGTA